MSMLFQAALTAFAAAIICINSNPAKAAETIVWRAATVASGTSSYNQKISRPFVELVARLTEGEVKIQLLEAGVLAPIFKSHEAVQDGVADIAITTPNMLGNKDPANAMLLGFPTGLGVDSFLNWVYLGGGQELLTAHRRETMGLHSLVLGAGPSEIFAHSHQPVKTTEDLKNLKYRTLGSWAAIVNQYFGASPTVVPGSEVYGMLEKQAIDLTEYSMPDENIAMGLHEVAPYIIVPGIHTPAWAFELVIKKERWDSLPKRIREKIEIGARLVTWESRMHMIQAGTEAMAKLDTGNNTLLTLDREFREQARSAARDWALTVAAKAKAEGNPWPERIAESIFTFQDRWRKGSSYMVLDQPSGMSK